MTVRTRPEPKPAVGGKTYHVYPVGYTGDKQEPAFTGLMCAYNYYCGAGDTAPGGRPRVKPGDIILMHAGTYAYQYEYYANQTTINATTTFEGTYYLTAKGTPEKPIVIKGAGDGEVIIDGRNNFNLFNMKVADYNYIEGITFRNTSIAIWAGTQFIAGAKGITVKHCRFEQVGIGVFSNYSGSSNFYIADNVVLGRNDSKHLIGWNGAFWQQFDGRGRPGISAGDEVVHRHPSLRPGPCRLLQLRRRFSRRHRHRDVRHARRLERERRADLSAARVSGTGGRCRSTSTTTTSPTRTTTRSRWTAACTTSA